MVYRISWAPRALEDLKDLVDYIRRDRPIVAREFGLKIIQKAESLSSMPERGRLIPNFRDPTLREVIVPPYRIAYRINRQNALVEIARVWHGARSPEDFTL